jgi:hypothetical protein
VFVPRRIEILDRVEDVFGALLSRSAGSFRETALFCRDDLDGVALADTSQAGLTVGDFEFAGDRLSLTTESPSGGVVVILNTHSPFWRVTRGGACDRVLPVYHMVQAVLVKPGRQNVELRYCPPYRFRDGGDSKEGA